MEPRFPPWLDPVLVLLFDGALWLVIAGAARVLRGLLLPGSHWEQVAAGSTTLGLACAAAALALWLLLIPPRYSS